MTVAEVSHTLHSYVQNVSPGLGLSWHALLVERSHTRPEIHVLRLWAALSWVHHPVHVSLHGELCSAESTWWQCGNGGCECVLRRADWYSYRYASSRTHEHRVAAGACQHTTWHVWRWRWDARAHEWAWPLREGDPRGGAMACMIYKHRRIYGERRRGYFEKKNMPLCVILLYLYILKYRRSCCSSRHVTDFECTRFIGPRGLGSTMSLMGNRWRRRCAQYIKRSLILMVQNRFPAFASCSYGSVNVTKRGHLSYLYRASVLTRPMTTWLPVTVFMWGIDDGHNVFG